MADNPTIIAASLSDSDLRSSIDKLVQHVEQGSQKMADSFDSAVRRMKESLGSINNVNINFGGGGSTNTKAIDSAKKLTQANKEVATSFDNIATAAGKSTERENVLTNYDSQIQKLIDRLKEVRQDIDIFKTAIGTGNKSEVEWGQKGLKEANAEAERLMRIISTLEGKRESLKEVMSPQGHSIQNFVQSLQKANPELERLNQQFKEGKSLTQDITAATNQTVTAASKYTEEIRKQAEEIRKSEQFRKTGEYTLVLDKESGRRSWVSSQSELSIEQQLLEIYELEGNRKESFVATEAQENAQLKEQLNTEQQITSEVEKQEAAKKKYVNPNATEGAFGRLVAKKAGLQSEADVLSNAKEIKQLTTYLNQLQTAYSHLTEQEQRNPFGKSLRFEIQAISRDLQKLKSEMNRPISFESVMNLPTKTLDDMAYKMKQFNAYRQGIDLTKPDAKQKIDEVDMAMRSLQKDMDKYSYKSKGILDTNNALGRSWNYMKNRLAFYFTVGASTQFINDLIKVRGQYELLERSIGILFDSMQTGTRIFAELNAMAIKSPFTTMELGSAAKQLSAYNIAAKDVVDTTKRLADIAAAVGIPIERLTYALGQIKSYGYLNSRDARMFANAGIPLIQNLADMYTKLEGKMISVGDVYDRIKKKQISFEDTMQVINEMTDEGGRFFNFQEKAADTLVVKIANLNLAWNNFLNSVGKSYGGFLSTGLSATKAILENWREIENAVKGLVVSFGLVKALELIAVRNSWKLAEGLGVSVKWAGKLGNGFKSIGKSMLGLMANPFFWIGTAIAAVSYLVLQWDSLRQKNEEFLKSISDGAKENIESIGKFLKDYGEQLESIGGMNEVDQKKLWERVQEEIEKTTKNAEEYIRTLEKIQDIGLRAEKGKDLLNQQLVIQKEIQRLADRGTFSIGGGFANENMAEDLKQYEEQVIKITTLYGNLATAEKEYQTVSQKEKSANISESEKEALSLNKINEYQRVLKSRTEAANAEITTFINNLSKANIRKIMGDGDGDEQLANLRDYTNYIRDMFLATEDGQKIGVEGQALLNSAIDKWINNIASANGLYDTFIENGSKWSASQIADIEKNRTAWEAFFNSLSVSDQKAMEYLVKTGQTGTQEFKDLWNKAAEELQKSNETLYGNIKDKLDDLRSTPPIIIDIIYRERKEQLDEQQTSFEERHIKPKQTTPLRPKSRKEYEKEEKENRRLYGTLNKKKEEDNVEWEKRLGEEYQKNEKTIKSLNNQLKHRAEMTAEDIKAKEKELDDAKKRNSLIKEVGKEEGFDYDQFGKGNKKGGNKKDTLAEALQKNIQIAKKLQGEYDKLTKKGTDSEKALSIVQSAYGRSLREIQKNMQGLQVFDPKMIQGANPNKTLEYFKKLREDIVSKGLGNMKRLEAVDAVISELNVEVQNYNMSKVIEGLNSAFDNVKEEYELAVQLDASPMFGGIIADMLGVNKEDLNELPRTANEVIGKFQKSIDEKMQGTGKAFDLSKNLNKADFDKWVEENGQTLDDELIKVLNKYREESNKVKLDEAKRTVSTWESLIEKYGDLQSKIIKIAKDTVEEQLGIIRQFGNEVEKSKALELVAKIRVSEDPAEIANLQKQLTELQSKIAQNNPKATQMGNAVLTGQARETSKAKWNDFVNSDMYSQTFEDMGNLGVRSLQLLKEKLDELKNDVKEDPASMKALMKQLEDVESELSARNPLLGISEGLKMIREGSEEAKTGLNELNEADKALAQGQKELDEAEDAGDVEAIAAAQKKVADATKKRTEAQKKVIDGENKQKKGAKNLTGALGNLSGEMQNVQGALSGVSKLLRQAGLDDEADAVDAINEGFSTMVTVIELATAAIIIMQSSCPYLLAIAAVLATIVGLVTFLSGQDNKKIDKEVKESELAVKQLEVTYVGLQHAIDKAYGASVSGAKLAMTGAKELELAEVQRQLRLEKSRKKKDRDQSKILELEKQVRELKYEILDSISEVTEALLGSDAGSFAESLVSDMIEAFKNGEDYMKIFSDKFDEMIDNMIMKSIVSRVVSQYIDQIWEDMDEKLNKRSEKERKEYAEAVNKNNEVDDMTEVEVYKAIQKERAAAAKQEALAAGAREVDAQHQAHIAYERKVTKEDMEEYRERYRIAEGEKKKAFDAVTKITDEDIDGVMQQIGEIMPELGDRLRDILGKYYKFGESSDKELSALQQGISGITEETASAIEAYLNIVSQRIFEHGNLLTEIRDVLQGFNFEAQLGTQAEMLLQLQQSYSVQMAIQNILRGTLTPSGSAFMVELNS